MNELLDTGRMEAMYADVCHMTTTTLSGWCEFINYPNAAYFRYQQGVFNTQEPRITS